MDTRTIDVESVVVGETRPGPSLGQVSIELATGSIAIRDLIAMVVEEQVHDLLARRRLEALDAQLALDRQYLSAREVADQAARGRVSMPSPAAAGRGAVNVAAQVAKALDGFERKVLRVVIDGRPAETLEERVALRPETKVTFLRLVPLVGG
jgi:hypothetical protein